MVEVLEFIFRSFWTWLGTVILILSIAAIVPHFKFTRHIKTIREDK